MSKRTATGEIEKQRKYAKNDELKRNKSEAILATLPGWVEFDNFCVHSYRCDASMQIDVDGPDEALSLVNRFKDEFGLMGMLMVKGTFTSFAPERTFSKKELDEAKQVLPICPVMLTVDKTADYPTRSQLEFSIQTGGMQYEADNHELGYIIDVSLRMKEYSYPAEIYWHGTDQARARYTYVDGEWLIKNTPPCSGRIKWASGAPEHPNRHSFYWDRDQAWELDFFAPVRERRAA